MTVYVNERCMLRKKIEHNNALLEKEIYSGHTYRHMNQVQSKFYYMRNHHCVLKMEETEKIREREIEHGLSRTLAKLTIGVGAVYVTVDQGIWDGIGQGDSALNKVKQSVLPATSEYLQKIPSLSDVHKATLHKWNAGVETTFTYMARAPETAGKYCKQATNYIMKSLKS